MGDGMDELKKRVLIIAEVGCNHNGHMDIARKLIRAAADAGVDAVKFQTFDPGVMIWEQAPKAAYQIRATGTEESQYERLCRLRLTRSQHQVLKRWCEDNGVIFCSTPFDSPSAELLQELKVPFFKIASGEITNLPLLEQIAGFDKPMILSTGMSNLGEIETALSVIGEKRRHRVTLMHCVSEYPASWAEANLKAIPSMKAAFRLPVGYSDHTEGIELPLVAVGLGAVVIEKHITLDRRMEGGDHLASLEPGQFSDMVQKIRSLEAALGNGVKRCMPSETNVRTVSRKSLFAARSIKTGSRIRQADLVAKRPGTGISPALIGMVLGAKAVSDIDDDEMLTWSKIEMQRTKSNGEK